MKNGDIQRKEIETIRERRVTLNLSDADCDRISKLCGQYSLTVGKLIENFIGDLVDGTYSNGSDERRLASEWFDRCWFGMFPYESLLRYLLINAVDVDAFLTAWDEKEFYETHPEEYVNEVAELEEGERLWFYDEVDEMLEDWSTDSNTNMSNEIERCRIWLKEYNALKQGADV